MSESLKNEIVNENTSDTSTENMVNIETELRSEIALLNDKYLRAIADAENTKRRARLDAESMSKTRMVRLATDIFPVLDAVRAAIANATDIQLDGLLLIEKSALDALGNAGIKPIPTVNAIFDPKLHFAVNTEKRDDLAKNTILAELQSGFTLDDIVLRPAMVMVSA